MSITNVERTVSIIAVSQKYSGGPRKESVSGITDRAVLSEKSRELYGERSAFETIRTRIRQGFYADPEVVEETITNLLADGLRGLHGSPADSPQRS